MVNVKVGNTVFNGVDVLAAESADDATKLHRFGYLNTVDNPDPSVQLRAETETPIAETPIAETETEEPSTDTETE